MRMTTTTGASPAVRAPGTGSIAGLMEASAYPRCRYAARTARVSASSRDCTNGCPFARLISGARSEAPTAPVPSKRMSATR